MTTLDEKTFLWINGLVGRWHPLDAVMRMLVNDYFMMLLISFLLLVMWFAGRNVAHRTTLQVAVLQAALGIVVSGLVVKLVYVWWDRPRPFDYLPVKMLFYEPVDPSFPAKPAAVAFAAAVGIWLGSRKAGSIALVLASLFSVARVYAGVHFPGDVIGGAILGFACGSLVYWLLKVARPLPLFLIATLCKQGLA